MSGSKRGERSTGGSRPRERAAAEREEEDFQALLAERKGPADGRGTPMNIIRRPVDLPPMRPIKDG
jgi:hypothetical protein